MPSANRHGFANGASLGGFYLFRADQVEDVNQRWSFSAFRLALSRRIVIPVLVIFLVFIFRLFFLIFLIDNAGRFVLLSPPPSPPPFLPFPLLLFLLLTRVFVEEEDGPVLVANMGLVRQHELGQHVLVPGNSDWILMLHDGAAINVEGGNQDVLDMVLCRPPRVL